MLFIVLLKFICYFIFSVEKKETNRQHNVFSYLFILEKTKLIINNIEYFPDESIHNYSEKRHIFDENAREKFSILRAAWFRNKKSRFVILLKKKKNKISKRPFVVYERQECSSWLRNMT